MKVALLGTYPPPYGGISIHVQRLKAHLDEQGHDCVVYSSVGRDATPGAEVRRQSAKKTFLRLAFSGGRVIHYHDTDWRCRVITGFLGLFGKKTVISIHGDTLKDSIQNGSPFRRMIIKAALKHASFIIADNDRIEELVLSLGVRCTKVGVVSAFIPPIERKEDYEGVPQYIWDFMESHEPVVSSNAFRISFYNGIDLYGLDMIVGLVDKLINSYPNIGVIFCLPHIGDDGYFNKISRDVKEKNLTENILFVTKPLPEVYPIWAESDIFVRPTMTDGDPLSVREALFLKTPVVASDVCPRPSGVALFRNRDLDDFANVVREVWENYDKYKKNLMSTEVATGLSKILGIYNSLSSRKEASEVSRIHDERIYG